MNNKIFNIIFVILIISSLFCGCIDQLKNENHDKEEPESNYCYKYHINITTIEDTIYEVLVPILITPIVAENDDNVSVIMDRIEIVGNGTTKIVQTDHGKALKINGQGSLQIIAKGNESLSDARFNMVIDSDNDGLTADESGDVQYWIFINCSNPINLDIRFSQNNSAFIFIFPLTEIVLNDWLIANADKGVGSL
jgi:hypothetical protein